jgi:hypothetical protein
MFSRVAESRLFGGFPLVPRISELRPLTPSACLFSVTLPFFNL